MDHSEAARKRIFFLSAFDPELFHTVLQARFEIMNISEMREIIGSAAEDDPELECDYLLEGNDLNRIVRAFSVKFDQSQLRKDGIEVWLGQVEPSWTPAPYLIHTGWELPLLLDGEKKLACFSEPYPPMIFEFEDRFDR